MSLPKTGLILFIITVIATVSHSYSFSLGDQAFHLPFLYKALDPDLFSRDYLFLQPEDQFTWFYQAIAFAIKHVHIDIQWLFFVLYLLFRYLLTYALFKLSTSILHQSKHALISTAILSLPIPIGGTATSTFDISFMPRFATAPILVMGLTKLLQGSFSATAFLAGIILPIHPFSSVILSLALFATLFWERARIASWIKSALFGLIPSSIFIATRLPRFISHAQAITQPIRWREILYLRTPYLFLSQWTLKNWISLALPLLGIIVWIITSHNTLLKQRVKNLLFTLPLITIIYFFATDVKVFPPIFQLQLLRSWLPVSLLAIPVILKMFIQHKGVFIRSLALALLTSLFFISITSIFSHRPGLELPHTQSREWDELQFWVRNHTPKDSLILTPPHRLGFRVHSQRAIVAEIKDGSAGLYSSTFAQEWQNRISDIHPLATKTSAEILNIKNKYKPDYLVTFSDYPHHDFHEVFSTQTFIIYKI